MKVKRKISYEWWDCVIEIDRTPETTKKMKEVLLFWSNGQEMIDDELGDVEAAFLKFLAAQVARLSMEWNVLGVVSHIAEEEGFYPIDGSHGIKLVSCDSWYWDRNDMSVEDAA